MIIADEIGLPAVLEQYAEEAVEAAHAALKLSRILRGENPCRAEKLETLHKLIDESADVMVCMNALEEADILEPTQMDSICMFKRTRWENSIIEKKKQQRKGE